MEGSMDSGATLMIINGCRHGQGLPERYIVGDVPKPRQPFLQAASQNVEAGVGAALAQKVVLSEPSPESQSP